MYKTINKVFHNHGGKKKTRGDASDSINRSHSSEKSQNAVPYAGTPIPQHVAVAAAQDLRPDSPLRLGSPSIAAIGEATLKKIVKRAFYGEGSGAPAGRLKEVPTEMLAFEIGSIMRRMLEIYDSMAEKMLSSLRSNLQAPGVVTLISNDLRVLWGLAGYEKHEELRVVAARVAVLGRKGADVRLRRLERVLAHLDSPDANYKDFAVSSAEGEVLLRFMREQAEATNTLKAEMEAIQLLHSRIQEYGEWNSLQEMVTQGKLVEKLQGHCLWAYNLDYLVQLLVVAACYVRKKIFASFGHGMCPARIRAASLGEAGLALHYANVVVLLERIIQQPDAVLGPTRDELYDMLPRSIQYLLRVQLQDPLNFTADGRVEANLKRGLLLLPTMAHNTIHWHSLHTPGAALDFGEMVFQVQTFYYANREAVNATLVDVLLGLCRICGVEAPIGSISLHAPATADYSLALARSQEEDERGFRRQWGMEAREEDWFGGQVFKVADERRAPRRDAAQVGAQQGGHAGGLAEGGGYGGGGYGGGNEGQLSGDGYGEQGGQWQVQGGGMDGRGDGRGDGRAAAAAGSMGGGAFARVRVGQEEGRVASMDRRSGSWVSDASTDDNTTFGASSPSLSLSEAGSASSAKPARGRSSRLSRDPSLSTDGPSTPSSLASDRDCYAAEAPGAGDGGAGGRGGQGAAAPPAGRKASRMSSRKGSGSSNGSDRPSTPPMFSSPLRSPSADLPPTTPPHHSRTPQRSPRQGTGGDGDGGGVGGGEGGAGWGGHSEVRKSRSKKGARGSSSSSGGAEGGFFSSSGSFKDHGSSPMRPSNLSVPASVSSSPSPSSVPRQVSADALSVGSNDSDGRWSTSLSRRSSRWAGVVGFGKSKSSRLPEGAPPMPPPPAVVGGVQESVAGSSVEEGGALAVENPYDDPAFAGLDTPTLRKAMQSGGLVGCFTGGSSVADSDSEAESLSSSNGVDEEDMAESESPVASASSTASEDPFKEYYDNDMEILNRKYPKLGNNPSDMAKRCEYQREYCRDLKACVNAAAKSYSSKRMAEVRLEEERKLRQRAEVNVSELEAEVARLKEDKEQLRTQLLLLQSHAHAATQAEQQRRALVDHFFTLFNSMAHTE
ncbi:unnamed protein product, partial [Closterium sp. Yama58-4]